MYKPVSKSDVCAYKEALLQSLVSLLKSSNVKVNVLIRLSMAVKVYSRCPICCF